MCLISSIWLGLLLTFLLGLFLGWWLWSSFKKKYYGIISERDDWKNKYHTLLNERDEIKRKHDQSLKETDNWRNKYNSNLTEIKDWEGKFSAALKDRDDWKTKVSSLDSERGTWKTKLSATETDRDQLKAKVSSLSSSEQDWKLKFDKLQSSLNSQKTSTTHVDESSNEWKLKWEKSQTELGAIEVDRDDWRSKYLSLKDKPAAQHSTKVFAAAASAAAVHHILPKGVKQDDLTAVEGIGPKISEILRSKGIKTWSDLANSTPEIIQSYLESAGPRFKASKPGTWPEQAKLAKEGNWEKLLKWQDELDGGVEKA